MSLILNKTALYSASCVIDKTKEIFEAWRTSGESVGLTTELKRNISISKLELQDDIVKVTITETDY